MSESVEGTQLELIQPSVRSRPKPKSGGEPITDVDPVASVVVDTGLAHLDRPFEYLVPASMADDAVPGARVKVRFAGQDLDGFVVARAAEAEHEGRLATIRRVVSPEAVLTPAVLESARRVAGHYGGVLGDVLRLAVPPRHAAAEKALPVEGPETEDVAPLESAAWSRYAGGPAFVSRVTAGERPFASVLVAPAIEPELAWPRLLADAATAAVVGGRGSILIVPDARDVARVEAALIERLGKGHHVRLSADQGPQARYTAYLKVLRGHVRIVVGTRAAAFAPVADLGLVAWWDDGDDLHDEPRAPYPHVREVLGVRAEVEGAALLSAGHTRTVAMTQWCATGRAVALEVDRSTLRRSVARVRVAGEGSDLARDPAAARAHLPSAAWQVAKDALTRGPVLVQVPRRGYLPALSCQDCRRPARCTVCAGPLGLRAPGAPPTCRWCGAVETRFECPNCGSPRLRSSVVGARRTAEELGRAFPGVPVTTSGAGAVVDEVDDRPRLVISTPGAEPVAPGGYAACLLLDAWALLDRASLDAAEETLRRWTNAVALCRGSAHGGVVVLAGTPTHTTIPAVEGLVRWDPAWFAERELAERVELGLPPTTRVAALTGARPALHAAVEEMRLGPAVRRLGPLPVAEGIERLVLTAPLDEGEQLAAEVAAMRARRSARKETATLTVKLDPRDPTS
ncbi:primosomal protein N' [Knoellia subterranea]|uniref:Probable replication restart protein PriA n=1 Tax=Knoellia subterranea KCTC 19937 TaxID=1385521 RepID=A0A0A0JNW1_9MICO|nr:primosomal protein N' [Knoellia subterranea]KGN38843.1 primosome assembly protein PriA [Knoellia subterranea KCTC 19937]